MITLQELKFIFTGVAVITAADALAYNNLKELAISLIIGGLAVFFYYLDGKRK